jgi:hypothetical protein
MGGCGVKRAHLKALPIDRFSRMHRPRIDQDQAAGARKVLCTFVRKGLAALLDNTDDIIVVTMSRVGMLDVIRVQQLNIELRVMPDFRPFSRLHDGSNPYFVP